MNFFYYESKFKILKKILGGGVGGWGGGELEQVNFFHKESKSKKGLRGGARVIEFFSQRFQI